MGIVARVARDDGPTARKPRMHAAARIGSLRGAMIATSFEPRPVAVDLAVTAVAA
jgi:hypothetical protein